tara:strand:- start:645 stop:842 length:198 start_codon:yes stop_codon:yes gene_type:complete
MLDSTFMDKRNAIQEDRDWDEAVDAFMEQLESAIDDALDVLPPTLVVGMLETVKIGMMFGDEEED